MRRRLKRVAAWAAALTSLAAATLVGIGALLYAGADHSTDGASAFERPLPIPPVLGAHVGDDGVREFDLRLQTGRSELLTGTTTDTWGANGPHLGPTLRATRGERVRVRVRNDLPEESSLHWHGMHLPARHDGGPHQPIAPGATWSPEWAIDQPAASLWYHPHPHGRTEDHAYRGIAGLFLIDDPVDAPNLPDQYGIDDIPVILQDVNLAGDGTLDFDKHLFSPTGRIGEHVLVNGAEAPHLRVSTERVRLRVLNASGARVYDVGFSDGREFQIVAGDGGLLQAPVSADRVLVSPGERVEIVVGLAAGDRVALRSLAPNLGMNFFEERFAGGDDVIDLMELRAGADLRPSAEVPAQLAALETPDERSGQRTRRFRLQGQGSINGRGMDMSRIDEVVEAGASEVWEVENSSGTAHNFHIHGTSFRVLDINGGPVPAHMRGLQDTTFIRPRETVRLLVRFDHPDLEAPLMYHCHMLQHEDRGMMGQFLVVPSGWDGDPQGLSLEGHDHH